MSTDAEAAGPVLTSDARMTAAPPAEDERPTAVRSRAGMSITIAPQTILIFVGLATLTWAIVSVGGTLLVIFVAIFLAMVLSPVVDAASQRLNLGRGAASSLVVLGLGVLVVVLLLIALAPLGNAVRSFVHNIPKITREIEHARSVSSSTTTATSSTPCTSTRARSRPGPGRRRAAWSASRRRHSTSFCSASRCSS